MMKYLATCSAVLFLVAGLSQGAHFMPLHEMTYCQSDAIVRDFRQMTTQDPKSQWLDNWNNVLSATHSGGNMAQSGSSITTSLVNFSGNYEESLPRIILSAGASGSVWVADDFSWAKAYANASTVAAGYATGNFYRIMGDRSDSQDEVMGGLVTITVQYEAWVSGEADNGVTLSAGVHGGFAGEDMLVTRNCMDYDNPQENEILHRFNGIALGDPNTSVSREETFQVAIGDVIGIHAGVSADAERAAASQGMTMTSAQANLEVNVYINSYDGPPPFNPARADLNGDGIVDMVDFALFSSAWLYRYSAN